VSSITYGQQACAEIAGELDKRVVSEDDRILTIKSTSSRAISTDVTPKEIPVVLIHVFPENLPLGTGSHLTDAELLEGLATLNDNLAGINCIGELNGRDTKLSVKLVKRTSMDSLRAASFDSLILTQIIRLERVLILK